MAENNIQNKEQKKIDTITSRTGDYFIRKETKLNKAKVWLYSFYKKMIFSHKATDGYIIGDFEDVDLADITRPHWSKTKILFSISLLAFFVVICFGINRGILAATKNISSSDIYEGTSEFSNIDLSTNGEIKLQKGEAGKWSGDNGIIDPDTPFYSDSDSVYGPSDTLYLLNAYYNATRFKKYSLELKKWENLTAPPVAIGSGMTMTYDGDYKIYLLPGGKLDRLFVYDIVTDSWTEKLKAPFIVDSGARMTYVDTTTGFLYVIRGGGSTALWKYDILADSWSPLVGFPTSSPPLYGLELVWGGGSEIYAINNVYNEFKSYSIPTNTWTTLTAPPTAGYGSRKNRLLKVDNKIVSVQLAIWNDTSYLSSYNTVTRTWSTLANPPTGQVYNFSVNATYDGTDALYTFFGSETRPTINKYNFSTNSWNLNYSLYVEPSYSWHERIVYDGDHTGYFLSGTWASSLDRLFSINLETGAKNAINSAPMMGGKPGWAGVKSGNYLYWLPWSGYSTYYRYDLTTNDWEALANLPVYSTYGSDIVDGEDGYLYATLGANNRLYRYRVADNTWEDLNASGLNGAPRTIYVGGGLTKIGRTLYVLPGNYEGYFMKYDMDSTSPNKWTLLKNVPVGGIQHGGNITSDGSRYVYVIATNNTLAQSRQFYRYDSLNQEWKRIADLPANAYARSSLFYDKNLNKIYASPAAGSHYLWTWSPVATNYQVSGSWYSKVYDLTNVLSWSNFSATVGGVGATAFYSRTSDNGKIWDDWRLVSGGNIQSDPKRYLQLKASMSGDGSDTPVISNISFNYTQETNPPSLPSQFSAKDKKDGTIDLTTGTTYEYQHPYFEWSGSSDGATGSGIDGYYVYFGTDSGADPVTDGNYQSENNYTVNYPMNSGSVYYLRIAAKDKLGNISVGANYFSYRYWYISPPATRTASTYNDYTQGINSNLDLLTTADTMKLEKNNNGSWSLGDTKSLPASISGGASAWANGSLYVLRGNGTKTFWRYDPDGQVWNNLVDAPDTINNGSSMTWDRGDNLFVLRGNNTSSFYRYNLVTNVWYAMGNASVNAVAGADLKYGGNNKLFALYTSGEFYSYEITGGGTGGVWTYLNQVPFVINCSGTDGGAGLYFNGGDEIFAYFGSDDCAGKGFAKYTISQSYWTQLSKPPYQFYYMHQNLTGDGLGNLYIFGQDNVRKGRGLAQKYNILSDSWSEIRSDYAISHRGTISSDEKRYIYILPGTGTNQRMLKYDFLENRFTPPGFKLPSLESTRDEASSVWIGGNASSLAYDTSNNVYLMGANEGGGAIIAKYNLVSGNYEYLPGPPLVGYGGTLRFSNNYLYYLPARSTREFYRYNLGSRQWERMADTPNTIYRPGPMTLIADTAGNLYALRGNDTAFYKYTPDSGLGVWSSLQATPGSVLNGSAVYSDEGANQYIYLIRSNGTSNVYRYSIGGNSWSSMTNLPVNTSYGNTLLINNNKLYVTAGNATSNAYVFDISSPGLGWVTGATTPEINNVGAALLQVDADKAFGISGSNSPNLWQFVFPSSTKSYNGKGSHISPSIQINGIFDYASLKANGTIPTGTKVEFWTRTSDDDLVWDEWSMANQMKYYNGQFVGNITSDPKKYIQIKIELYSYDNLNTPTVQNYSLDYYFDVDPPSNPTIVNPYSDNTKTQTISNNVWYNYPQPTFDWPEPGEVGGATDGELGSRIKGYYVYFGPDETALPQTAGTFVEGVSQYEANLTTPGNYFFRLQAMDMTGNVDPAVFATFIYKFDNERPSNTPLISVTPSGFTSQNVFTFEWPVASDTHSQVKEYCYRTGATSGAYSTEQCTTERKLENIAAAYTQGTNVLYVRTLDNAGNYSADTYEGGRSVSFYYTLAPPSKVTNLQAIPPVSNQNLFSFIWDLPDTFAGDPNQLTYCYSINELPGPHNTTCSADRYIAPFRAATQYGTNMLYVVAKDEAGNIEWVNYESESFVANTISPGIPTNLTVTDTSNRAINVWALTLMWTKPTFEGNGIDHYIVERSEDGHAFSSVGTVSNAAYVDINVQQSGTYFYRVRASDGVGNFGGASAIVSKSPMGRFIVPPKIVTSPTSKVSFNQAEINWVTERESTSFVYFGSSPASLEQSKGTLDLATNHSVMLTGLTPRTLYYFKVQSFDIERDYNLNTTYSGVYSFRTLESGNVSMVSVTDITLSTAIINWITSVPTKASIEYGTSTNYGLILDENSGYGTNHILRLSNVNSGTNYHFRIIPEAENGGKFYSDDYQFKTIAHPTISNIRFQPITDSVNTSVSVTWNTNVPTDSIVNYRTEGTNQETAKSDLETTHRMVIGDLASNADYTFIIKGRDRYGNLATSDIQKWKSTLDTRPPKITDVSVDINTSGIGGDAKVQLVIFWKTDEPATSQVHYGSGSVGELKKKTDIEMEYTTNHVAVISNLELSQVYRIKPASRDMNGNESYGEERVVVTQDRDFSILEILVNLLKGIIGD